MKNFKEFINLIKEETTSADIAKVDSKLGKVKRNKVTHDLEGRDKEVEDNSEEVGHYEDLEADNYKSKIVKQQLKNGDRT
jgi:hypothetical protein